jgi:hypothetical protein
MLEGVKLVVAIPFVFLAGCGNPQIDMPSADGGGPANAVDGGVCPWVTTTAAPAPDFTSAWCFPHPMNIAATVESVFVITGQDDPFQPLQLVRIDKATGHQTVVVPGGDMTLALDQGLVSGGQEVFFGAVIANQSCGIFATSDSGDPPRFVVQTLAQPLEGTCPRSVLAVDDESIYWSKSGVWSAPRSGGSATRVDTGPTAPPDFESLAVNSAAVYGTATIQDGRGIVERFPLAGGQPTVLERQRAPGGIVASVFQVYWGESTPTIDCGDTAGTILAWNGVGQAQPVVGSDNGLSAIAAYGNRLLWGLAGWGCLGVATPDGAIYGLSSTGHGTQLIEDGQAGLTAIATDGFNIYWILNSLNDGPGAVMHALLPRPSRF